MNFADIQLIFADNMELYLIVLIAELFNRSIPEFWGGIGRGIHLVVSHGKIMALTSSPKYQSPTLGWEF